MATLHRIGTNLLVVSTSNTAPVDIDHRIACNVVATAVARLQRVPPALVMRRYTIDTLAGTFVNQFDITHNDSELYQNDMLRIIYEARLLYTCEWIQHIIWQNEEFPTTTWVKNVLMWLVTIIRPVLEDNISHVNTIQPLDWIWYRRVWMNLLGISSIDIKDFYRMRTLYCDVIGVCTLDWPAGYLFLKRRVYMDWLLTMLFNVMRITMWREGYPAIRLDPLKWYKKRLDPGDIIIRENPWI